MITWNEFERRQPALAGAGRRQLYWVGIGLAFLATVRPDGGPRVHPVCPVISDAGLHLLIVAGPKQQDLRRDGRYALHSETCPPPRQDDGFALAGRAREVTDAAVQRVVRARVLTERDGQVWPGFDEEAIFELGIERALLTLTHGEGSFPAGPTIWNAGQGRKGRNGGTLRYRYLAGSSGLAGLGSEGKDQRHDEPCSG